jgi:hypothetical protein
MPMIKVTAVLNFEHTAEIIARYERQYAEALADGYSEDDYSYPDLEEWLKVYMAGAISNITSLLGGAVHSISIEDRRE